MSNNDSYWQLLKQYTPNGSQTLSKMPNKFVEGVYPKVIEHGKGAHVWDVDGNEYIDLIAGLGAISVGYSNPKVNDAVHDQVEQGVLFSMPHRLEYLVAKKLTQLVPSTEQWKFTKTGSDATSMAVKCARAYTGRDRIIVCGYHGWHDWYSIVNDKKAGIPAVLNTYVNRAQYNNIESFTSLIDTFEPGFNPYAAVIMEPMVFEDPQPGFLEAVKDLCHNNGMLLIFDEVVTGGRYRGFVAQNYFKVVPDITVVSKGIANGFPLAALGARKSIMDVFERNDFFASTTFGGECVSLAASLATLEQLEKGLERMMWNGSRIQEAFNKVFTGTGAACKGYPTRLTFDFPTKEHKALFMQEMCLNGVLVGYSNMMMADHTEADVTKIIDSIFKAYTTLKANWANPVQALKGRIPEEVFRLR